MGYISDEDRWEIYYRATKNFVEDTGELPGPGAVSVGLNVGDWWSHQESQMSLGVVPGYRYAKLSQLIIDTQKNSSSGWLETLMSDVPQPGPGGETRSTVAAEQAHQRRIWEQLRPVADRNRRENAARLRRETAEREARWNRVDQRRAAGYQEVTPAAVHPSAVHPKTPASSGPATTVPGTDTAEKELTMPDTRTSSHADQLIARRDGLTEFTIEHGRFPKRTEKTFTAGGTSLYWWVQRLVRGLRDNTVPAADRDILERASWWPAMLDRAGTSPPDKPAPQDQEPRIGPRSDIAEKITYLMDSHDPSPTGNGETRFQVTIRLRVDVSSGYQQAEEALQALAKYPHLNIRMEDAGTGPSRYDVVFTCVPRNVGDTLKAIDRSGASLVSVSSFRPPPPRESRKDAKS